MPGARRGLGLCLALAAAAGGAGQPAPGSPAGPAAPAERGLVEREDVRLVQLPVVVTTRRGHVVRGLGQADFRLVEDGQRQRIRYFGTEAGLPISVAFLLDVSGSMRLDGRLERAKAAIRAFVDDLDPGDRFGLICFADSEVAWVTDFTSDREDFLARLEVQRGFGQTALLDALAVTPEMVDPDRQGRRAIVLITDGHDNTSRLTSFDAVRTARRVRVPIYVFDFESASFQHLPAKERARRTEALHRFAHETGGRAFNLLEPEDLARAIPSVLEELRYQYLISYYPTSRRWDGSFRRVELETSRPGLVVRTRTGYYATP